MLTFLVVVLCSCFFLSKDKLSQALFLPIALSTGILFFVSKQLLMFNSSIFFQGVFHDELSLFMTFMLFFVVYISFLASHYFGFSLILSLYFLLFCCYMVFTTSNVLILYIFYESSLIPIVYIIVKFGSYPDRALGAFMMLSYTVLLSLPFMWVLWIIKTQNGSLTMCPQGTTTFWIISVTFLAFSVKLPLYGLHFWLPMAHVEAPTFGSMVLAGVLLKLGGVGLYRLSYFMEFCLLRNYLLAYLAVCMVVVSIVAASQSDFKRLIAYSSVVHMMVVPLLLLSLNCLSIKSLIMVMFYHGLSSSVMFLFAGLLYDLFKTRQLILMRGLILVSPLLSIFLVLTFFFTLPAPPFPSFLSEVYFLISSYFLTPILLYSFLLFTFFALLFNLNWLCSILFYNSKEPSSYFVSYLSFLILASTFLFSALTLFLVGMF